MADPVLRVCVISVCVCFTHSSVICANVSPPSSWRQALAIPEGAYDSVRRHEAASSALPNFELDVQTVHARNEAAQNCTVGSICNCIVALLPPQVKLLETMNATMLATETERLKMKACGTMVQKLSQGACKLMKAKTFMKKSAKTYSDINLAFFQSDDQASYGCFVVCVTDREGGTGHTLALIRQDRENSDNNYVVDSNPLYGRYAHPFTTPALLAMDVVDINFAVQVVLCDGSGLSFAR